MNLVIILKHIARLTVEQILLDIILTQDKVSRFTATPGWHTESGEIKVHKLNNKQRNNLRIIRGPNDIVSNEYSTLQLFTVDLSSILVNYRYREN